MLSRLKITQKVYLLGVIQLVLMLAMGLTSFSQMNKIGNELIDIAESDIPLSNRITKIAEHQLEQTILFERSLLKASLKEGNISGASQEFTELKSKLLSLSKKINNEFSETLSFINLALNKLHSTQAKTTYQLLTTKLKETNAEFTTLTQEINEVLSRTEQYKIAELYADIKKVESHEDKVEHSIIEILDSIQKFTLEAAVKAEHDELTGIKIISYLFIGAVIIGAILPTIISRSITIPINKLQKGLVKVSEGDGDLSFKLNEKGRDETAKVAMAFNSFLSTLKSTIQETNQQASVLGDSSDIATQIMQDTLINIEAQQVETEMVSTAVEEMSSTTIDVANNALSASTVTENVRKKVLQGKAGAKETQDIIQRLSHEINDAAAVIQSLVSETNNIGSVLANIQGIAEQTNLLALNAAIEAARAGESGRGFAVVADEVRTLAQRTQTSTVDIQSLVERLQSEANNAVKSMEKGTDITEQCLTKSGETFSIFDDASQAVDEISELNTHIATAANQQSHVVEEVNKNLVNITEIANKTTQGAREASEANDNIAKSLVELYSNLNRFKV